MHSQTTKNGTRAYWLLATIVSLSLGLGSSALAAQFDVKLPFDSGTWSLREAIERVNAGTGGDTIKIFEGSLFQNSHGIWVLAPQTDLPPIGDSLFKTVTTIDLDSNVKGPVSIRLVNDTSDGETNILEINSDLSLVNTTFETTKINLNTAILSIHTDLTMEAEFSTHMAGDGALVKSGAGELAWHHKNGLDNDNADTTGKEIQVTGGVLRGDTWSLQKDIKISLGAYIAYEMPFVYRFEDPDDNLKDKFNGPGSPSSGDFEETSTTSGDGILLKTGTGSLTVLGDLGHTGGTYILNGELRGAVDKLGIGMIHVCSAGEDVSGSLVGATNWNGSQYNCDANGNGTLTFDQASAGILDNSIDIQGTGILRKAGSGSLTMTADQTNWHGAFFVDAGTLVLQSKLGHDNLTSTMTVNSRLDLQLGGIFNGDVTIAPNGLVTGDIGGEIAGNLTSVGTVSPYDYGHFTVGGNYTSNSGSRFGANLDVGTSGNEIANHLEVTGNGVINNLTIDLFSTSADVRRKTDREFELIHANSLTIGNVSVNSDAQAAAYTYRVDPGDTSCKSGSGECLKLILDYRFATVSQFAETDNQESFAQAFDAAGLVSCPKANNYFCTPGDDLGLVYDEFQGEGASTITRNNMHEHFGGMDGDELLVFSEVRMAGSTRYNRSIARRFDLESAPSDRGRALFGPRTSPLASMRYLQGTTLGRPVSQARRQRSTRTRPVYLHDDDIQIGRRPGNPGWTSWADFKGIFGELDDDDSADIDYTIFGPLIGLDFGISDSFTVGGTIGYTRDEFDTGGDNSEGTADTYQAGLYVGGAWEEFYFVASGRYAYSDMETKRKMKWNSTQLADRTARGDFDGTEWSGFVEASWGHQFDSGLKAQPMASVSYHHLEQESFEEHGANSLNLSVPEQTLDIVTTQLGVRLAYMGRPEETIYVYPQFRLSWERDWNDLDRDFTLRMPGAAGSGPFEVEGPSLPKNRIALGISTEAGLTEHLNLFFDYDARLWEDFSEHSVALGFRLTF